MGELGFDDVSFASEVFTELSTAFDQVLAECNHYLKTNYFSVIDEKESSNGMKKEVITNGKNGSTDQPVTTTPCSLCGRKFLPERLVSTIHL